VHQACDALDDSLQGVVRDMDVLVRLVEDCGGWQMWGQARS
jgi:hypothetical protein